MIDAMDRFRMLQKMATPKVGASQPTQQARFGQQSVPMHSQPKDSGDVFVKSTKPADKVVLPEAPAKTASPMGASLRNFVKNVSGGSNPLIDALKKLTPASQPAGPEPVRKSLATLEPKTVSESPFLKAGEKQIAAPGKAAALQPTSAQINHKKVSLFAGAAVTSAGLSALTATVAGPAALAANPSLINKIVSLLPTQLP